MNKLLISVVAALASSIGVAEAAVVEFGAKGGLHRIGAAHRNSMASIAADDPVTSRAAKPVLADQVSDLSFGLGACMLSGGAFADCKFTEGGHSSNALAQRSIAFISEREFEATGLSFSERREIFREARAEAFFIDGARQNTRGRFVALIAGLSPAPLVADQSGTTEFDQNDAATIPLPASALLILTGLGAFGVAARRRRGREF